MTAIALAAGMRASAGLTSHVSRQSRMMLAQVCAENELVKIRLSKRLPGPGTPSVLCEQAGQRFFVTLSVAATPTSAFRRVDAQVSDGTALLLNVSTLVGSLP